MRYHFIGVRMAIIFKKENNNGWQGKEKLGQRPLFIVRGDYQIIQPSWKIV